MSDFQRVAFKKKRKRNNGVNSYDENSFDYFGRLKSQVLKTCSIFSSTDVYLSIRSCLEETLYNLQKSGIPEMVCYGLGNISEDNNVKVQFGLILELKKFFHSKLFLYDPLFKKVEKELIVDLDCNLIEVNEKGRRKANTTTLFFLPHTPHELLNNVIAANWGEDLCDCIIISNSVEQVCTKTPDKDLSNYLPFILKVHSFVTEIEIEQSLIPEFKYLRPFNDLSVHFFLKDKYKDLVFNDDSKVDKIVETMGELHL